MNTTRTFIYKDGDAEADSKIQMILGEGWKLCTVTPNGSVRITTFIKNFSMLQKCATFENEMI